jgi:sterol desaturase/sphingolipid hydroxylase (fatty acid hydroxylase superfamily)
MNAVRTFLVHFVSYWTIGLVCDTGRDLPKIAKNVLKTQFGALLPALLAYQVLLSPYEGLLIAIPDRMWPVKFMIFHKLQDCTFYAIHKYLLHSRIGYSFVHKYHHEFKRPVAVAALYGHWLEMILSMIPVVLGPLLFGASDWMWEAWTVVTTFEALVAHDPNISEFHPGHHRDPTQNFALGLHVGLER